MSKETLRVMGRDIRDRFQRQIGREGQNLAETVEAAKETIVNAPRNIANFGLDFMKGYGYEQVWSSANVYTPNVARKLVTGGLGGTLLGGLAGAVQDTAMAFGTMLYFNDVDNPATIAATALAGAKVASNVAAAGIKWYLSARDRAQI